MRLPKSLMLATFFGMVCLSASPASARRTVIDAGFSVALSGYCSPMEAASVGCSATALPFSLQIAGQTYNSVFINSNGTLSFNSIAPQLALQNSFSGSTATYTGPATADSLGDYAAPIFSPMFLDGPGFGGPNFASPTQGYDGILASTVSISGNSLTVDFFTCTNPIDCGMSTILAVTNAIFDPNAFNASPFELEGMIFSYSPDPLTFNQANFDLGQANFLAALTNTLNIYSITLTGLSDGFMVDYTYNPGALGDPGISGFNLPSGLTETNGPLANSSFRFGSDGQLLTAAVPEPATWLSMLLGFALTGAAVRRRKTKFERQVT